MDNCSGRTNQRWGGGHNFSELERVQDSCLAGGIQPHHQQRRRLFLGKQALRKGLAPAVKRSVLCRAARSSLYPAHARSCARQDGAAVVGSSIARGCVSASASHNMFPPPPPPPPPLPGSLRDESSQPQSSSDEQLFRSLEASSLVASFKTDNRS
jgi:hypothetical protein